MYVNLIKSGTGYIIENSTPFIISGKYEWVHRHRYTYMYILTYSNTHTHTHTCRVILAHTDWLYGKYSNKD